MPKSLGNVVKPLDLAGVYGIDAFRYFLIRNMNPARDADFSADSLDQRYQTDLANNLGNLLNRIVTMIERYCHGRIPQPGPPTDPEKALIHLAACLPDEVFAHLQTITLHEALDKILNFASEINGYLERTSPWHESKHGRQQRVETTLYYAAEALRLAALLLHPVMPHKTAGIWQQLSWQRSETLSQDLSWGQLQPGTAIQNGPPLFPREART
jgi:methionyl-tRNA synthetase